MCVESDGCEMEACSSSDEVRTLSGSLSPGLKSNPDLHPCKPSHKFRAALRRCRSPLAAAGILSFGNVLNYMDRYTVAGKTSASAPPEVEPREGCAGCPSARLCGSNCVFSAHLSAEQQWAWPGAVDKKRLCDCSFPSLFSAVCAAKPPK